MKLFFMILIPAAYGAMSAVIDGYGLGPCFWLCTFAYMGGVANMMLNDS